MPKTAERIRRIHLVAEKSLEGCSYEELMQEFGVSRDTVERDLRAARQILIEEMGQDLSLFFWRLVKKSQHLERLAYQQFYASMKQKQRKKTKVKGYKAAGSDAPEQMQVVETVLDSETNLTGNPKFLNLVFQQLQYQANLMGYMKSGDVPTLPTMDLPSTNQTVIAMPGSNVQVNTMNSPDNEPTNGIGIAEANVEKVLKLRQIELLKAELRELDKVQ